MSSQKSSRFDLSSIGHCNYIASIAVSPDSKLLATGGRDGMVKVWQLDTGKLLGTPVIPKFNTDSWPRFDALEAAAFSPDGKWLACGTDMSVLLFEAKTLERVSEFELPGSALAFLPDGSHFVCSGGENTVALCDLKTGARIWEATHFEQTRMVAVSADGKRIALSGCHVAVLDASSGKKIREFDGTGREIAAIAFSPFDGRLAIFESQHGGDAFLKFVDPSHENFSVGRVDALVSDWSFSDFAFSGDGRTWAVVSDEGRVYKFDPATASAAAPAGQKLHYGWRSKILGVPDGRGWIVAGERDIQVVDSKWCEPILRFGSGVEKIKALAVDPPRMRAACAMERGQVRIWNLRNCSIEFIFAESAFPIKSLSFNATGTRLLGSTNDGTILLWDVSQRALKQRYQETLSAPQDGLSGTAISPNGKFFACRFRDGVVFLRELASGNLIWQLPGNEMGWTTGLAFSPSGDVLAVGRGSEVDLLNAGTGRLLRKSPCREVIDLSFSSDGSRLCAGCDFYGYVFDSASGIELARGEGDYDAFVSAISLDGKQFLTASMYSELIFLYDVATGVELKKLAGHLDGLRAVRFLSNSTAISAADDGTLRIWDLDSGSQLQVLASVEYCDK